MEQRTRCHAAEQFRDWVMPVTEAADELRGFIAAGPAGRRTGKSRAVHAAIRQGKDCEPGAPPPCLARCHRLRWGRHDNTPACVARISDSGMAGKQRRADGGTDAVGANDEIGSQLAAGGSHPRAPARRSGHHCRDTSAGLHRVGGQQACQRAGQVGSVQRDHRVAETVPDEVEVGARYPVPAGPPYAPIALFHGAGPHRPPRVDRVQSPQAIGRQADATAGRPQGPGSFAHDDLPAEPAETDGCRQSANTGTDHHHLGPVHHFFLREADSTWGAKAMRTSAHLGSYRVRIRERAIKVTAEEGISRASAYRALLAAATNEPASTSRSTTRISWARTACSRGTGCGARISLMMTMSPRRSATIKKGA